MKKFIAITATVIITAFIFSFSFYIFNKIFFQKEAAYLDNALGAFMGAFFAFLFMRISEVFTRIYERKKRNQNALVKLENICNEYMVIIGDNLYVLEKNAEYAEEIIKTNKPIVSFNTFQTLPTDKEVILDLTNIDLVNEVFSFGAGINKINNAFAATNRFYTTIQGAFTDKKIDFENYKLNIGIFANKLKELKLFLSDFEAENKKILALVRILLKDKPILASLQQFLLKKRINEKIQNKLPQEIAKIEKEVEETRKKSQEKIDKILSQK